MKSEDKIYIWQQSLWPQWVYDLKQLAPSDRHVDGVVDMVLDTTQNHTMPLTSERLFGWHAAIFPTGYSGLSKIHVGQWRDDAQGPMQVVSGPLHRQKVYYEAPPAHLLDAEMQDFLNWFNLDSTNRTPQFSKRV